jgi:rare lipoprotein A
MKILAASLFAVVICATGAMAHGATHHGSQRATAAHHRVLDHSGRKQVGKASFYARKFAHRKMANGKPMNPRAHIAASKTLPLGTVAKGTNLHTGQSTVVTIEDRGPHVRGRIVDLSPAAAQEIGITAQQGVAPVEVAPIEVPLPDGSTKPGEGANG